MEGAAALIEGDADDGDGLLLRHPRGGDVVVGERIPHVLGDGGR